MGSPQLYAVKRNLYAWMTVGSGISACTASVLSGASISLFFSIASYPDPSIIANTLCLSVDCRLERAATESRFDDD